MDLSAALKQAPVVPLLKAFSGEVEGQGRRRISHHTVAAFLETPARTLAVLPGGEFIKTQPTTRVLTGRRGRPTEHFWLTELDAIQFCLARRDGVRGQKAALMIQHAFDVEVRSQASSAAFHRHYSAEQVLCAKARNLETEKLDFNGKYRILKEERDELDARLELQNRHLERHQGFTREAQAKLKEANQLIASLRADLRNSTHLLGQKATRINELELTVQGIRQELDRIRAYQPPKRLNVAPSGKYARAAWFSYRIAESESKYEGFRQSHGLELLADLGVCDRRGIPTETGRPFCRPDGGSYKWDMALVELMQLDGGKQAA